MSQPLPPPRKVPVVPRPRHGELSASYLARVARANRTEFRSFAGLLGRLPSGLPSNPSHLTFTIVTLNDAAFARLLAYTGREANRLIRAIPSLAPATFAWAGEPPALRVATLREQMHDCPQCLLRRDGAFIDTRLFPLTVVCLRHGYWLYRDGAGDQLDFAALPEIAIAQRRLNRMVGRLGAKAALHAYRIANSYLEEEWQIGRKPWWYHKLEEERWLDRAKRGNFKSSWLPTWARHPECVALARVFASPYWAELAVPAPDRRHRLFYQHLLAVLGVHDDRFMQSLANFNPLGKAILEQARWGRLLSDPEWGSPIAPPEGHKIGFTDITDDYERSIRGFLRASA